MRRRLALVASRYVRPIDFRPGSFGLADDLVMKVFDFT
jgi:hypothetical protein